jgi:hypothetical protein
MNGRIKRPRRAGEPAEVPRPPTLMEAFFRLGFWGRRRKAFIMAAIRVGGSEKNMHMTRPVCSTYLTVAVSLQGKPRFGRGQCWAAERHTVGVQLCQFISIDPQCQTIRPFGAI